MNLARYYNDGVMMIVRGDCTLGIDSSTQGTSAVILDRGNFEVLAEAQVRYRDDPRLLGFGLDTETLTLPPSEPGEAHQPAALYLAALEAVLQDLPRGLLARVAAIDISAQQHGQVWLGDAGRLAIAALKTRGSGAASAQSLASRIEPGLSWDRAPIWLSANSLAEASALRAALGGSEAMTARSGSDSPLRFSGAVLMRSAKKYPGAFLNTRTIHLISSFLSAVLSGNADCPIDWGNGSGTSLMDWALRRWDHELLAAAERDIGMSKGALSPRLPRLAPPLEPAGNLAAFFVERFGMSPNCHVLIGSGDNPQSKVLAAGSLLSLGTSFVLMVEGERPHVSANAMYDGMGRPFILGCRTNGALVWESIRSDHGLAPDDFASSEAALAAVLPGEAVRIRQIEPESFPVSAAMDLGRESDFRRDYAGAVDSSLGLLWLGSRPFAAGEDKMAVTGGAVASPGILARVASIWRRKVLPLANSGAARGAALAAALALMPEAQRGEVIDEARAKVGQAGMPVEADPRLVEAYHRPGGYLAKLELKAKEIGIKV